MNRTSISYGLGAALLIAAVAFSAWTVLSRGAREITSGARIIRFAHWQLESGARDRFDAAARAYEARHPGVRVEQIVIPQRIYDSWLRTRLIGGTAPDLVEWASFLNQPETEARHFLPLDPWLDAPNPYQAFELRGSSWRADFLDGAAGAYNPALAGTYWVPVATFTLRLHVNRDLWSGAFGDRPYPADFAEFAAVCAEIESRSSPAGRRILATAASDWNAVFLLDRAAGAVTQRLTYHLHGAPPATPNSIVLATAYLDGRWSLRTPAITTALEALATAVRTLPTGFQQFRREDALFQFLQGHAFFYATGSWDGSSLSAQSTFPVDVIKLPTPSPSDPGMEGFVVGPFAELSDQAAVGFAVTRASSQSELALDFLRFLTSAEGAGLLVGDSGWLSPVRGAPLPSNPGYAPVVDGYPQGMTVNGLGLATKTWLQRRLHAVRRDGAASLLAGEDAYRTAVFEDLGRMARSQRTAVRQLETSALVTAHTGSPDDFEAVTESLALQQFNAAWIDRSLTRAKQAEPSH